MKDPAKAKASADAVAAAQGRRKWGAYKAASQKMIATQKAVGK